MSRSDRRPRHLENADLDAPGHHDPSDPRSPRGPWGADGHDQAGDERAAGGRDLAHSDAALPEGYWDDVARLDEIEHAARVRRVPHLLTGVTAAVGAAGWGCVQLVDVLAGPGPSSATAAVVGLGAALAVPIARAVLRERIAERWARTWWVATSCAAAWVIAVVVQGADLLTPGVGLTLAAMLVLGSWVLGARWADEHEVPDPCEEDLPDPSPVPAPARAPRAPVVDTSEAEEIEQDWAARVAGGRNPIARGSELTGRTELPHGFRWVVCLDREESVNATALESGGTEADVAHRLGRRRTHVALERLLGGDDREDRAMLTVVTRDVLAAGVAYPGPLYQGGVIPIGAYADGTGQASWRVHNETGVLSGLVTGSTGSGKSALMTSLGMACRGSGEWVVLFGDGDAGGTSSPLLGRVAHDYARGPDEVLEQLQGLEAIAQVRGPLMGTLTSGADGRPVPISTSEQSPVAKIMPCPRYPGIVWILDEFWRLAQDAELQRVEFVDRVAGMVRILRKYGGAVIVGTQSALGDDFDGNSVLRGMLAAGNTVVMRTKNKSESGIVTDGFAPNTLPEGGGYAFLGEGERRAMIRGYHPGEDYKAMERCVPDVLADSASPDSRSWAAYRRYRPVRELDPHAEYQDRIAQLAQFDDAVVTGAPLPGSPEARQAAEQEEATAGVPVSVGGFAVPTLAPVVPIRPDLDQQPDRQAEQTQQTQHRPTEHRPTEPDRPDGPDVAHDQTPASAAPLPSPLPDKARQVLAVLESRTGSWRSGELVEQTGLSAPDVSKALRALVDRGLAHRPSGVKGVHVAGPAPAPAGDQPNQRGAV